MKEITVKKTPSVSQLMRSLKLTRPEAEHVRSELLNRKGPARIAAVQEPPVVEVTQPMKLFDPTLQMAADVLDDLERSRIANENRLRQLTRSTEDSDGQLRGMGLRQDHPGVLRLTSIVDGLARLEKDAIKNLENAMRQHPLGAWGKQRKGVGDKQFARLLATIGDPYWNSLYERPRTVSELWAYAGLHTDNAGAAVRHKRGVQSNWNDEAKMRAWNIAVSCVKLGGEYRETYDKRRSETSEKVHAVPCVRCGPSGSPAPVGTPWSKGHQHADALRIVSKEILKDLWIESRRLYNEA